ncbi:hypothetical protein ACLOJK_029794 [Asimina triloba]
MAAARIFILVLVASASLTYAYDSSPLQDFCVAILKPPVFVNGFICKDPKKVTADDFFFTGLNKPASTANEVGSTETFVTVNEVAGLNTMGIGLGRIDFAPGGLNPPHEHPRASELLTVLDGTLLAGFVTSNPNHKLFTKILNKGDAFTFPRGLIHFQLNLGNTSAVALAAFGSQNPGRSDIANVVFGSNPKIHDDILAKAFRVDKKLIDLIQARF